MSDKALHVTMLPRSTSDVVSPPSRDGLVNAVGRWPPATLAHRLARVKSVASAVAYFQACRRKAALAENALNAGFATAGGLPPKSRKSLPADRVVTATEPKLQTCAGSSSSVGDRPIGLGKESLIGHKIGSCAPFRGEISEAACCGPLVEGPERLRRSREDALSIRGRQAPALRALAVCGRVAIRATLLPSRTGAIPGTRREHSRVE